MVYRFMKENMGRYSIREMAGLFGVTGGAYHKRAKKEVSERRDRRDTGLPRLIREIQMRHHKTARGCGKRRGRSTGNG
jgi:hypothetical protein